MAIKIYISGISGNKEVKKRQQRVLMILDSKNIKYDVVDIAEPGNEDAKEFMQNNAKSLGATVGDANPRSALPPQIFNDSDYCGDYDQFDMANELDEIEKFLKMPFNDSNKIVTSNAELKLGNGEINVNNEVVSTDVKENLDNENITEKEEAKMENKEDSDDIQLKETTDDVQNEEAAEKGSTEIAAEATTKEVTEESVVANEIDESVENEKKSTEELGNGTEEVEDLSKPKEA